MGRLSIVAGLVLGIVAAVVLLGGIVVLAPVSPGGPTPTPLVAATPSLSISSPAPTVAPSASPEATASAAASASADASASASASASADAPVSGATPGVTVTP